MKAPEPSPEDGISSAMDTASRVYATMMAPQLASSIYQRALCDSIRAQIDAVHQGGHAMAVPDVVSMRELAEFACSAAEVFIDVASKRAGGAS